jgi:hypothetical protein
MTAEDKAAARKEERRYLDALFWGGILLWAGLIFGADSLGFLPQIGQASAWSWVFLGAGLYGLLLSGIRLISPGFSNPSTWDYVWAVVFLIIGFGGFIGVGGDLIFPLILLLIGGTILVGVLLQRG